MAWDGRALSYALRTRVDRVRIPLISDMGPGKAETLEVLGDIAKPSLENCGHLDVHKQSTTIRIGGEIWSTG